MATNNNRRTFIKVAGSSSLAVLAGCLSGDSNGDTGDDDGGSEDGDEESTDIDNGQTVEPQHQLVYADCCVTKTLDPSKNVDLSTTIAHVNFYDPLVFIEPETFDIVPHLATDWSIENGGQTWVFSLRDDVTFHSGNQLTADDVVYTMDRMTALGEGYTGTWADVVQETTAQGDYTVEFNLTEPFAPFLNSLTRFMIIDGQVALDNEASGGFGDHGDYAQGYLSENVAGSGPYKLDGWQRESSLEFEWFEDYWGPEWRQNNFASAQMKPVEETSTLKNLMRTDEAHISNVSRSATTFSELEGYGNVDVEVRPSSQIYHVTMNTQREPTDDIHVRKALAHAFDYETAIKEIFQADPGLQATGPVPDPVPGKNTDLNPYTFDLNQAEEELQKAEYSKDEISESLEFAFVSGLSEERQTGLLLQGNLQEIGIELEIQNYPWADIVDMAGQADSTPPLTAIYHSPVNFSPDDFTYFMFHPDRFGSWISMSWYTTDELQQTMEEARTAADQEAQVSKYKEAQGMIHEAYPSIFILYPPYRQGVHTNISGWEFHGISGYQTRWNFLEWNA